MCKVFRTQKGIILRRKSKAHLQPIFVICLKPFLWLYFVKKEVPDNKLKRMFNFACSMPPLHSKTGLIRLLFSALVASFLLSACVSRKSSAYFQNDNTGKVPEFNLTLRSGDLLSIAVTANDAELVVPFDQTSAIAYWILKLQFWEMWETRAHLQFRTSE